MADEELIPTPEQSQEQQFVMQRIYTKDLSFESPDSPSVFLKSWQPKISVDLNTKSNVIDDDGNYEVVLSVTVTAEIDEKPSFLIEVQQAGVFLAKGLEGDQLRSVLGTVAPTILFPYARECIDALCLKGGFPAIMLAPVNFEALYQEAPRQSGEGNQIQ